MFCWQDFLFYKCVKQIVDVKFDCKSFEIALNNSSIMKNWNRSLLLLKKVDEVKKNFVKKKFRRKKIRKILIFKNCKTNFVKKNFWKKKKKMKKFHFILRISSFFFHFCNANKITKRLIVVFTFSDKNAVVWKIEFFWHVQQNFHFISRSLNKNVKNDKTKKKQILRKLKILKTVNFRNES